ncbi:MAG: CvpA family protein [Patescibacteria group bacterium]|nr:CvpA family protein [Patescibacteria group bacterium]
MTIFDIMLFIILGGFTLFGFWFGLIHTFGALFGVLIGAGVASRFFDVVADFLHAYTGGNINALKVIVFIILFLLINRLVGFVFYLLEKSFRFLEILPFLAGINRLMGAVLGFLEGGLIIGLFLYFASIHPFSLWLSEMILEQSQYAHYFLNAANILMPLLPEALKELEAKLPEIITK